MIASVNPPQMSALLRQELIDRTVSLLIFFYPEGTHDLRLQVMSKALMSLIDLSDTQDLENKRMVMVLWRDYTSVAFRTAIYDDIQSKYEEYLQCKSQM